MSGGSDYMVVIEGPDGAGKTTLVRQLQEDFKLEEGQRGTKDRSLLYTVTRRDTYTALSEAVCGHGPPKIWDRLFFSEQVYAPLVGRECEFSEQESIYVRRALEAMRCPVIVCLPPLDVVQNNITKDKQMAGVNENIDTIWNKYDDDAFMGWPSNTVFYDYTARRPVGGDHRFVGRGEIWTIVSDYIDDRKARQWT